MIFVDFKKESDIQIDILEKLCKEEKVINIKNEHIDSDDYHLLKGIVILNVDKNKEEVTIKLNNGKEVVYNVSHIKIEK